MKSEQPFIKHPDILRIDPYTQGTSSIAGIDNPIKLSSNENPFGASPSAIEAIKDSAERSNRYPDGSCLELRKAIAALHCVDSERIVCGAGSDELISLLCQAFAGNGDEILYSEYGFLMYSISALRVGATPIPAPEKDLSAGIDGLLSSLTEKTKIVFIANPNNPTGSYLTKDNMRALRNGIPNNILLVIDSAYGEYVTEDDYSTGIGMVDDYPNTVMIRTFSKIYGLSSLRLGWAYCQPDITDILNRVRGPFNVSDAAQAAGIAAVKDQDFIEKTKDHNKKWKAIVEKELSDLGLKVYPSVANFLLVEFQNEDIKNSADDFLKKNGIIARSTKNYSLPKCMRFTIGLEDENKMLLNAMKNFMKIYQ